MDSRRDRCGTTAINSGCLQGACGSKNKMARSSPLWRHYGGRVIKRARKDGGGKHCIISRALPASMRQAGACMHHFFLEKPTSPRTKFLIGRDRFVCFFFFWFDRNRLKFFFLYIYIHILVIRIIIVSNRKNCV